MTLMEIMIAISIIAVVSTMIWSAFSQTSRNRAVIEKSIDRYHQVAVAFERIAADISMAHLSTNQPSEKTSLISEPGFVGKNGDPDTLDFTSFSHLRRWRGAKEGDRCEVGYSVAEDKEREGVRNLVRREATVVDENPSRGGKKTVVVEDVTAFDVEYFDPAMEKWEKEWDTTQATGQGGKLPLQVRIYLTVKDEAGREVDFVTQLPLDIQVPIVYTGGEL